MRGGLQRTITNDGVVDILRDRGYRLEKVPSAMDLRDLADLQPVRQLVLSEAFLEHKEQHKNQGKASYLSQRTERKVVPDAPLPPTPAELRNKVHQRTKALVAEAQREAIKRAIAVARRSDELGIIKSESNRLRAETTCRMALRRTVSLGELQRQAAEDVALGRCEKLAHMSAPTWFCCTHK